MSVPPLSRHRPRETEIVQITPSIRPDYVCLTSFAPDGSPFMAMEIPARYVKRLAPWFERFTVRETAQPLKIVR